MIQFDKFLINIDTSNDVKYSTIMLINVASTVAGKIHIINYTNFNIRKYYSIDDTKEKEFIENVTPIIPKLEFVEEPIKSFTWIQNYIDKLSKNDFIVITGAEKLLRYNKQSCSSDNKIGNMTLSIHTMEQEDWGDFSSNLDNIFQKYQDVVCGIFVNINTDNRCSALLNDLLKESENMSISGTCDIKQDIGYESLQRDLIKRIKTLKLEDSLKEIDNIKTQVDETTYRYLLFLANYFAGDLIAATKILETDYQHLQNETKLILADIYISSGSDSLKERAAEILSDIYRNDKYLKGIYDSYLRLYSDDEDRQKYWLNIALKYDPESLSVIEANASFLSRNKEYGKAAIEFRKISKNTMYEYYELLARINEILDNKFDNNQDIINYIEEHCLSYPNITNEAAIRLARYFIQYKESYFLAYKCLKRAKLNYRDEQLKEIIGLKINILEDEKKAAKALGKLKIYTKLKDAQKLGIARTDLLLESIYLLSGYKHGYLIWRNFLDCQKDSTWNMYLYAYLKDEIKKLCDMNISSLIESYNNKLSIDGNIINNININDDIEELKENAETIRNTLISVLRMIKGGEKSSTEIFKDYNEMSHTMCTIAELIDDDYLRLCSRYYLSIIAIRNGDGQIANEKALETLEHYPRIKEILKPQALMLGLISWANSQFRAGRHVEAIACIIVAIKYATENGEIMPVIEEGLNLVARYLNEDVPELFKNDIDFWSNIKSVLGKYNETLNDILTFDLEQQIQQLTERINDSKDNDEDWAISISNLSSLLMKNNKKNEAKNIVDKYKRRVIPLLEHRKDIRFSILYTWSMLYLDTISDFNSIFKALDIIKQAEKDIEFVRESFSHKEERSGLGDAAIDIYRLHLGICGILNSILRETTMISWLKEEILNVLPKLLPRTILEQKRFNSNKSFSAETENLRKELDFAISEYNNICKKDSSNHVLLSQKAKLVTELSLKLKKSHPYYMNLQEVEKISLLEISTCLSADELLFQYIVTPVGVFTFILTANNIIFDLSDYMFDKPLEYYSRKFSELMQRDSLDETELLEVQGIIEILSKGIFEKLNLFVIENNINRIYCIPDFMLQMFPISVVKTKEKALIECVQAIYNLIDYSAILNKDTSNSIKQFAHRIFGNLTDSNLLQISNFLNKLPYENSVLLESKGDKFNITELGGSFTSNNCLCIYGHGVSDPNADMLYGSKGIEGITSVIDITNLMDNIVFCKNLILISCRSGSPNYDKIDETNGIWNAVFECYSGNIIMCKWDVMTQTTVDLLNDIFMECINNNSCLAEALIVAQRKLMKKFSNPQLWAGLEFWIN